jgi:hypothetical protein
MQRSQLSERHIGKGSTSGRDFCRWKSENRGCPENTLGESESRKEIGLNGKVNLKAPRLTR